MSFSFFKYITPFRIVFLVLLVVAFFQFDDYYKVAFADEKDGFRGIGFVLAIVTAIIFLIADLILSYFLNPKKNWISQIVAILLFLVSLLLF